MDILNLDSIPLIDTHTHRIHPDRMPDGLWPMTFCMPGPDQEIHAKNTIFYHFLLKRLGEYYGLEDDISEDAILMFRNNLLSSDPSGYFKKIIDSQNVLYYLMENGSPLFGKSYSDEEIAWFDSALPKEKQRNIARIERVIDDNLSKKLSFDDFSDFFDREFDRQVAAKHTVAIKTCIAYYGGFNLKHRTKAEAKKAYDEIQRGNSSRENIRAFYQYFLYKGVDVAKRYDVPVQIHTGQGAARFLDYETLNPNHLADFLLDQDIFDKVKIVLLHGAHPYEEHVSHLVLQFSNVYTDFSGATWFTCANALPRLRALMERAPLDKIMYGSDASSFPEFYWYSPTYFREILYKQLRAFVSEGYLGEPAAVEAAKMIMYKNALSVYTKIEAEGV